MVRSDLSSLEVIPLSFSKFLMPKSNTVLHAWTFVSIDGKCISLQIKVASRVIDQLDAFDRLKQVSLKAMDMKNDFLGCKL